MTETAPTRTLPVLPLPQGVVLPGMVVTIALESTEARLAAEGAAASGGELLLVPRIGDRYARVGVVASTESRLTLPGGTDALVVRAARRARVGSAVIGATTALWLAAEPVDEG